VTGSPTAPLRVGGQALPDGVLMRTERAWAIAHADGRVETGTLPAARWKRIPVIRILAGLLPAMALGFGLSSGTQRRRRAVPWAMIRAIVLAEAAVIGLDAAASHAGLSGTARPFFVAGTWLAALLLFRLFSPAAQWRYHGAEHKAVTAHERGIALSDVDAVLACSRIHNRCGTNIVFWLAIAAPFVTGAPFAVEVVLFLLLLGAVAELITLAGRHDRSLLGWLALAPGRALQAAVTTREPLPEEQRVGCQALIACLATHDGLVTQHALTPSEPLSP